MKEYMHTKCQRLIDEYGNIPKDIPLSAYIEELGEVNGGYFHTFFSKHAEAPATVSDGATMSLPPMKYAILDALAQARASGANVLPAPASEESAS